MDFSTDQALQILYLHQEQTLDLTEAEVKVLQLEVIHHWESLQTHYKQFLCSQEKLDILSLMANNEPIFNI